MNDIENKRITIEKWSKRLGFVALCIFLGPFYLTILHGIGAIAALAVAGAIGLIGVNLLPAFSRMVANWKLKALKAVAAANPIETLENQYGERAEALISIRENIKEFHSVIQELWSQIEEHNQRYPNNPSQFLDKYNKMKELLELRSNKYKQAQANLKSFKELIEQKRSDWKVAQSAAKAMKLANVGESFQNELMKDTALNTIQDGLNLAFSELEVSLLDEETAPTTVSVISVNSAKQITAKAGPPSLDLVFDEGEKVGVERQKIAE